MEPLLIGLHILVSFLLVVIILLQSGKGGGLGAGLGGAAAAGQQIFGGRGAGNFLSKGTVVLAAIFMSTSLALAYLSSKPRSALDLTQTASERVENQVDRVIEEGGTPSEMPSESFEINIDGQEDGIIELNLDDAAPADTESAPADDAAPAQEEAPEDE